MTQRSWSLNMFTKFIFEIYLIAKAFGVPFAVKYFLRAILVFPSILKFKSLGPVDRTIRPDRVIKVNYKGQEYYITGDMLPTSREIFLKDCYKVNIDSAYRTIIDLGANRGNFSIIAAKYGDLVISVECDKIEMPQLFKQTMVLNKASNVRFENYFISNLDNNDHISVNSLIKKHNIKSIDLIKIDIEGAEADLFSSNTEWLDITSNITMEVHPCFNVSVPDIVQKLKSFGFKIEVTDLSLVPSTAESLRGMGYLYAKKT